MLCFLVMLYSLALIRKIRLRRLNRGFNELILKMVTAGSQLAIFRQGLSVLFTDFSEGYCFFWNGAINS